VRTAAVNRKFGHDVFKECSDEASQNWEQTAHKSAVAVESANLEITVLTILERLELLGGNTGKCVPILFRLKRTRTEVGVITLFAMWLLQGVPHYDSALNSNAGQQRSASNFTALAAQQIDPAHACKVVSCSNSPRK
jgi:hypothetical protein